MACAYLNRFFALPKMKTTCAAELKALLNGTNQMLRQLRAMKYPVDRYDLILVHALQQRLNAECAKKWEKIRKGAEDPENPALTRMLEFLDEEATLQANQGLSYATMQVTIKNNRASQHASASAQQGATQRTESLQFPCPVSKSDQHKVFSCPEFKPLTLSDRMRVVNQTKMCHRCLKHGHYKHECYDLYRCREPLCVQKDDIKHNSMLCPIRNRAEYVSTVRHDRSTSPTPYRSSRKRGRGHHGDYRSDQNRS